MSTSKSEKVIFFFLSSTLLLVTILCFIPLCPFLSPYLQKLLSSFLSTNYDATPLPLVGFPVDNDWSDDPLVTSSFIGDDPEEETFHLRSSRPLVYEVEEPIHNYNNSTPDLDEKEEDVMVLAGRNFTYFIATQKYVMVNFYAPSCCWSTRLAPEYAAAASFLKDTEAVVAKVDGSNEPGLRMLNKIDVYPTMVLFIDGGAQKVVYNPSDNRTGDAIANWVTLKMNPHVQTVAAPHEVQYILTAKPMIVLAFLDKLQDPISEELTTVAKLHIDTDFYQTTNVKVARLFHIDPQVIKRPALFMLKRDQDGMNHSHFSFDGEFTSSAISEFVFVYKQPSVIKFTAEDAPLLFDNPKKQLWLFSPKSSYEVTSIFSQAALAFKGRLLFIHVETHSALGRQLSYSFGVPEYAPSVMAYIANGSPKKQIYDGELTLSGVMSFVNEFLEDRLMVRVRPPLISDSSDADTDSVILKLLKLTLLYRGSNRRVSRQAY